MSVKRCWAAVVALLRGERATPETAPEVRTCRMYVFAMCFFLALVIPVRVASRCLPSRTLAEIDVEMFADLDLPTAAAACQLVLCLTLPFDVSSVTMGLLGLAVIFIRCCLRVTALSVSPEGGVWDVDKDARLMLEAALLTVVFFLLGSWCEACLLVFAMWAVLGVSFQYGAPQIELMEFEGMQVMTGLTIITFTVLLGGRTVSNYMTRTDLGAGEVPAQTRAADYHADAGVTVFLLDGSAIEEFTPAEAARLRIVEFCCRLKVHPRLRDFEFSIVAGTGVVAADSWQTNNEMLTDWLASSLGPGPWTVTCDIETPRIPVVAE